MEIAFAQGNPGRGGFKELQAPIDVAGVFHIKKKPAFHEEGRLY